MSKTIECFFDFGAPTIYIDGEMFFGQDRLPMIEKALQ